MLIKMLSEVSRFGTVLVLFFGFIESCPIIMQDGWKQMSVEDRAKPSDVVAIGRAIEVLPIDESYARPSYAVNFQLLDVLKGKNITDKINIEYKSSLFKIYGFGNPMECMSSVVESETYLLFAILEPTTLSLVGRYDSPFGATAQPTEENQVRILTSLGWGPWSDWSSCSTTCGGGSQSRMRRCRISQCNGPNSEQRDCNNYYCEGVKNLLEYFKLRRNPRSIPESRHRNASRITNTKNFSVPTNHIFWHQFPEDFTMFASAKYVNYTEGYLLSFHDSQDRLQIGIKVTKESVALEYVDIREVDGPKSSWKLAFNVEIIDSKWHQFAFSVQNNKVKFYLDCQLTGTKKVERDGTNTIDRYGNIYLGAKTSTLRRYNSNTEFYVEQLSFSEDAQAGGDQCAINNPYGYETDPSFSGSGYETGVVDGTEIGDTSLIIHSHEDMFMWSPWTRCSHTCGKHGMRRRVKMCKDKFKNRPECLKALQDSQEERCNKYECPAHCQQYCMNGGTCYTRNKCRCTQGFYGISCEKVVPCKHKCLNGGRCIPSLGTCKCPRGYSGKNCKKANCIPSCLYGGICVKPGICKCREGYLPPLCKPSCHPPCMNKGDCVLPGICRCQQGYSGNRCQRAICSKPCLNGGRCYFRDQCNCKSGWTGETCNIAICHPKCLNGGRCRTPNRCSCPNETSGTYCQHVVCYPRCMNGGTCVQGNRCLCSHRYKGNRCQTPLCNPQCQNGGKCVAPNQCVCLSGYFGDSCERRSCIYKPRVVPQRITHLVPITTTSLKRCFHPLAWRPCTEERTEYRTVHITSYRTIYYCS